MDELEARLVGLVRGSPVLMRALRAARSVNPPDWVIGAGAIRDRVWDHLHGFTRATPVKDVDLAFFDPASLDGERERGVQRALNAQAPELAWDVTNQAAVHLWYPHVFGVEVEPAYLDIGRGRHVAGDRHGDRRPAAIRRRHPRRRSIRPRRPVRAGLPAQPAARDGRAIPPARGEQADRQAVAWGEDHRCGWLTGSRQQTHDRSEELERLVSANTRNHRMVRTAQRSSLEAPQTSSQTRSLGTFYVRGPTSLRCVLQFGLSGDAGQFGRFCSGPQFAASLAPLRWPSSA